jgi:PAS domain S-box-containing protein
MARQPEARDSILARPPADAVVRHVLEAIAATNEPIEAILSSSSEALLAFTADRRIVAVNAAAESLFGYRAQDLAGRATDDLVPLRLRQPHAPPLTPTDDLMTVDLPGLRRDGLERSLVWTFGSAPTRNGPVFVVLARDRSELDRADAALRASEERLRLIVDGVSDHAIFLLDPKGRVATWNPSAEKIKGYRADEIVGQHFSIFYTDDDRAAGRPSAVLERARRDGRVEDESWRVRRDGSRFWASVVVSAVRDGKGELIGYVKVTRDLTARRAAEENERRLLAVQAARSPRMPSGGVSSARCCRRPSPSPSAVDRSTSSKSSTRACSRCGAEGRRSSASGWPT